MAGNYEKGMYNQLMEVMARLDAVEKDLHIEKTEHKEDVNRLNIKIDHLTQENQLLRDDNARLKSIINNDSSNTTHHFHPPRIKRVENLLIPIMAEKRQYEKMVARKAIKGPL